MTPKNRLQLRTLILQSLEGAIDSADSERLADWLASSAAARSYYLDVIEFNNVLLDIESLSAHPIQAFDDSGEFNDELLRELIESEKRAPTVETRAKHALETEDETKTIPAPTLRPARWFWIRVALTSMAALILLVLIMHLVPQRLPVGHIVSLRGAEWHPSHNDPAPGRILYTTDGSWRLQRGFVTLNMDCGAEVVVEGPAVFSCRSDSRLFLQEGRICTYLSVEESCFTIDTPTSRVVDLGTEFGVQVDEGGTSHVQVYEGATEYSVRSRHHGEQKQVLRRGMARTVDASVQRMRPAHFDETAFARYVDQSSGYVWRGEPVDLADVVGGGSGFQSGIPNAGLSVTTGTTGVYQAGRLMRGSSDYVPVADNPLVDGVFIVCEPGQSLSTTGIRSHDIPETDAVTWGGLIVNHAGDNLSPGGWNRGWTGMHTERWRGPGLVLSINTGITFDLHAIAARTPWLRLDRMVTRWGAFGEGTSASLLVLVDGDERVHNSRVPSSADTEDIVVPLDAESRFLTIMVVAHQATAHPVRAVFLSQPRLVMQRQ